MFFKKLNYIFFSSIPNISLTQSVSETMPIPAVIDRKPVDNSLINYAETDPVTKAVMDNIMGTLSTNKQVSGLFPYNGSLAFI